MKQIDIGAELEKGWNLFKPNMGLLIVAGFIASLVSVATCLILAGPLSAGIFLVVRRLLQNDPVKPQAGDVFKGLDLFVQALLVFLISMAGSMLISMVLRVIPFFGPLAGMAFSLAVSSAMMWAMIFVAYERRTATDALKRVFDALKTGAFTTPFLFGIIASLISNLGLIACGVGVFFTMPLGYCMMACCYQTLYGDGEQVIEPEVIPPPPADLRL